MLLVRLYSFFLSAARSLGEAVSGIIWRNTIEQKECHTIEEKNCKTGCWEISVKRKRRKGSLWILLFWERAHGAVRSRAC